MAHGVVVLFMTGRLIHSEMSSHGGTIRTALIHELKLAGFEMDGCEKVIVLVLGLRYGKNCLFFCTNYQKLS